MFEDPLGEQVLEFLLAGEVALQVFRLRLDDGVSRLVYGHDCFRFVVDRH